MQRIVCPILLAVLAVLVLPTLALAKPVVDASSAEAAFSKGNYKDARSGFDTALSQFLSKAPRDGMEHKVYNEAEYLLDRLADCSFTQRDWPRLRQYMDSQWRIVNQDISACEEQFNGTLRSNNPPRATAQFVANQLDEAMRLRQIFQLKRSLALMLVDSKGSGPKADKAIRLYQQLALAMRKVVGVQDGGLRMDLRKLSEEHIAEFEAINAELPESEMRPLWDKYAPAPKTEGKPADPKAKTPAKPSKQ
jgi:hypothetical protein